jgi:thioredoxin reductase (NADPH)
MAAATGIAEAAAMHDVIVIGGGPAGLTAASYLGRFRRPCFILDGGASRAHWIPESHNIPGFPQGVGGEKLLEKLRSQACRYGARLKLSRVHELQRDRHGFRIRTDDELLRSRFVVLATGIQDRLPELPGLEAAMHRGILRVCPVCDGYEAIGKRIAVIGEGERAIHEAEFLTTFSDRVTFIYVGPPRDGERQPSARQVEWIDVPLASLSIADDALEVRLATGQIRSFDTAYAALGCKTRNELALNLGARCDESNALLVDAHQETSVPGLYAAGDLVRGLNQVVVAAAEAAIAATAIHNRLRTAG